MLKKAIALTVLLLLILMIPIIAIGSVASNPLAFIGDSILEKGDTKDVNEDILSMYSEFVKSELGTETILYLHNLETINDKNVNDTSVLLALMLSYSEDDYKSISDYDFKSLKIGERLDKLFKLREAYTNESDYWRKVKSTSPFTSASALSDTTLSVYSNAFSAITSISNNLADIDVDRDVYQNDSNPFIPEFRGQCTWYAWSRTLEVTGKVMPTGNARDWYHTTNLPKGKTPKSHSVAVFAGNEDDDTSQHVLFVEEFKDDIIVFSEGNYNNPCVDGTCDFVEYARDNYKSLVNKQSMSYRNFLMERTFDMELLGYIYTD